MKLEEKLPALVDVCAHAARALPEPRSSVDQDAWDDLDRATKDLEKEFSAAVGKFSLTGPILSFILAVISISSGANKIQRVEVWFRPQKYSCENWLFRAEKWLEIQVQWNV